MNLTITKQIHFRPGHGRRKQLKKGPEPALMPQGKVPKITRLMALAIRLKKLVDEGHVTDYADLARLGHVSRARITQIMNLLHIAPDIQEDILFLPKTEKGRDAIGEWDVRPICAIIDWRKQRSAWGRTRKGT